MTFDYSAVARRPAPKMHRGPVLSTVADSGRVPIKEKKSQIPERKEESCNMLLSG
jgi:hypothetical protein